MSPNCPTCRVDYDGNFDARTPRILRECGHTLCEKCIERIMANRPVINCPVCKRKCRIPQGKVHSLQTNTSLLKEEPIYVTVVRSIPKPCSEDSEHRIVALFSRIQLGDKPYQPLETQHITSELLKKFGVVQQNLKKSIDSKRKIQMTYEPHHPLYQQKIKEISGIFEDEKSIEITIESFKYFCEYVWNFMEKGIIDWQEKLQGFRKVVRGFEETVSSSEENAEKIDKLIKSTDEILEEMNGWESDVSVEKAYMSVAPTGQIWWHV